MDRHLFTSGLGSAGVGIGIFAVLAIRGALRHPAAATAQASPVEFLAIGTGFVLLTIGALAAFLGYVRPGIEGAG